MPEDIVHQYLFDRPGHYRIRVQGSLDKFFGANAVVNADLPDGAVAAGVPARVLRSRADSAGRGSG